MLLHTTTEAGNPAVYINGGSIAARSIYSAQIQANAIIAEHLRAGQISSDHISTAGITADNIKGKTLSSSVPVSSGGSFINLDTGNINFAGGNLTWDNTTKTFYINASTLQIGGKNVLNTDTDLAKQINNKGTTRIQGNKLHFTNKVLMDDAFIELLTANNIFAQKIDAREIDANRITSGTLEADYIQGGTFDGQSMIVKNITADAIKGGTFDGQSMTIKNLTADAIVAGTLDMSKFTVSNLSADDIQTGSLDISGGLRVTSGPHQIMSIDPETLELEFNVNKMRIGGVKLISEDDQPQMEENIANQLENKIKPYFHIAYADDESGNGFSFNSYGKTFLGTYSDYTKEPSKDPEAYVWGRFKGDIGDSPIVAYLTNDSHMIPADENGIIPTDEDGLIINYDNAYTEMHVMDGIKDDTGSYTFSAEESSGITGKLEGNKYTVTSLNSDVAEVKITATSIEGSFTINKVFTVTKSKQGFKGTDGTPGDDSILYQLNTDTLVVIKDIDDVYSQDSISLTSLMKVGLEDYKNNPVYFRIYEQKINPLTVDTFSELSIKDQVDNREYILSLYGKPRLLQYESFIKESHIDYKLGTDIMSIFVEIYEDENFTKIIDSQSIAVIAEPKPNYKLEIHSTNGNSFVNGVINTEMYVTLYRGEEDITDSTDAKHFIWTRVSSDTNSDTVWNNRYKVGAKQIIVTKNDVNVRAKFSCNFIK